MEDISSTLEGIWHKWVVHATLSRIFIGGILESLKAVCSGAGQGEASSRAPTKTVGDVEADNESTVFGKAACCAPRKAA